MQAPRWRQRCSSPSVTLPPYGGGPRVVATANRWALGQERVARRLSRAVPPGDLGLEEVDLAVELTAGGGHLALEGFELVDERGDLVGVEGTEVAEAPGRGDLVDEAHEVVVDVGELEVAGRLPEAGGTAVLGEDVGQPGDELLGPRRLLARTAVGELGAEEVETHLDDPAEVRHRLLALLARRAPSPHLDEVERLEPLGEGRIEQAVEFGMHRSSSAGPPWRRG